MLKQVQHDGGGEGVRFRAGLVAAGFADGRLGLAVSGGPDSLALLLLAREALPGRIAAATVDHGLRAEAADEAACVAGLCARLDVPHAILTVTIAPGGAGVQGEARAARYAALAGWAVREGLTAVATAHHADDQAETLLMRLARGSGIGGLVGVRRATTLHARHRPDKGRNLAPQAGGPPDACRCPSEGWGRAPHANGLPHETSAFAGVTDEAAGVTEDAEVTVAQAEAAGGDSGASDGTRLALVRPLLDWRRAELAAIVARAGVTPVTDPSNSDPRYDRTAARALLGETRWIDPARLAAAAAHLAEAEAALGWAAELAWAERAEESGFDPSGLPAEIVRRLALRALALNGAPTPRGPDLARLIAALHRGESATLGGILARVEGGRWRFAPAPPRRCGTL